MHPSRRHEDYVRISPSSRPRSSNLRGRTEMGHHPYVVQHRDAPDRSRGSPSPAHKVEGSRRVLDGQRLSRSTERRDHGWQLVGARTEKISSRSPQYGQFLKRPSINDNDEEVLKRGYGYPEDVEFDYGAKSRLKHVYGYEHDLGSSSIGNEKNYPEDTIVNVKGCEMPNQKLIPTEDGAVRASYWLSPDNTGVARKYDEPGRSVPFSSRSIDVDQYDHEKPQYRNQMPSGKLVAAEYYEEEKPVYYPRDKLSVPETYKEGNDKPMFHSRDSLYAMAPASHSKDFGLQHKEYAGTSSGPSMKEVPVHYRDSITLPTSDGNQSSVKLTEAIGQDAYGQKPIIESMRGATEAEPRDITYYQDGLSSPSRTEGEDYIYTKTRVIDGDDRGYLSGDLCRMIPSQRLDYNMAPTDYDHQELSRPRHGPSVRERIDSTEHPRRTLTRSSGLEYYAYPKQTVSNYLDTSRTPYAAFKEDEEYFYSESTDMELERTVPSRDYGMSHVVVPQKHEISYSRSDYAYCRDADQEIQEERMQYSSDPYYDSHKLVLRAERSRGELGMRETSEKMHKRKISMENDMPRHSSGTSRSTKWNLPEHFEDPYGSYGDYIVEEDMSVANMSKSGRFTHNEYRKVKRPYEGRERPGNFTSERPRNFTSDGRFSSRGSFPLLSRSSVKFYSHNNRHMKGPARPGSSGWHNSHHSDRRDGHLKQHKIFKRNEHFDEDAWENDGDASEDCLNLAEAEPSEDSEEFKQLVQKAFFLYSKKLNLNSSVRRRYKEQGRAGSLFCIACGKSVSKEFLDTQRLVTHAYMCLKVGLRARHLGLHKAVCVLMGWNTVVPYDTKTWVPEVLPLAEAMAQKEDLILWPPLIVIRNISMSNNNPKEQKVIPIEQVEAFLRGKDFGGGKITVSLGRPADQSIMVVKFLGTFTGLNNAERLHKYFAENKHGRPDFNLLISNNGSSLSVGEGTRGGNLEDKLLYGYMGISEDLDGLDFNTKRYCVVKSRKEIMDLADAPVKPNDR